MTDQLDIDFKKAIDTIDTIDSIDKKLSNETMLELYKYFKQATFGNCCTDKPYFYELKAVAKWEAWKSISGMDNYVAKQNYIDLVNSLTK